MTEVIEIHNVVRRYRSPRTSLYGSERTVRAVDDVTLSVGQGRTLGIVGESGSGKSTLARLLLALETPDEGRIMFKGRDVTEFSRRELKSWRREVQAVFQHPVAALPPRMKIASAIEEPLRIHGVASGAAAAQRARELLSLVGLAPAHGERYPHQLSGGQCQRAVIARALALNPQILVCDEPVSALDVSVQATILNLLRRLQKELTLTLVFISHDLGVVRYLADDIAVLYRGSIVEHGPAEQVFDSPRHPYTRTLLAARPVLRDAVPRDEIMARSEVAQVQHETSGCKFAPRCAIAAERCFAERPGLREIASNLRVACHFPEVIRGHSNKIPFDSSSAA